MKQNFQAVSRMAKANMSYAPSSVQDALRERADVLNLPPIGCPGNTSYGTIQANIANAVKKEEGSSPRIELTV
jgi:hypothetical protein